MTFPLEYAFQKEFYRSFYTVVDGSVMISPEYVVKRGKCGGTIDFLVSSKGLGFELLRNRDKIVEHMNRFEVGGAYYHLIDTRVMQKYIVLDFTCMMPHKQRPEYQAHLYHAVFSDGFGNVSIVGTSNLEVVDRFTLLENSDPL